MAYANKFRNRNKELLSCVNNFVVYETSVSDEEKQNILEKTHLLGHFGIHAKEQVMHQNLNMHWKGLRKDIILQKIYIKLP